MCVQQFIINFRESIRQELETFSFSYGAKELLNIIDSCLLESLLQESTADELIVDD